MVALGVIAILCTILMPMIFHAMPNQNALMAKKAFYATQTIVSELINDDNCYPDKTNLTGDDYREGFDDGYGYANCPLWGGSSATSSYITSEGECDDKFVTLFWDKFNVKSKDGSDYRVITSDGMYWNIWGRLNNQTNLYIEVDVNGLDKGPNCGDNEHLPGESHGGFPACQLVIPLVYRIALSQIKIDFLCD